MDAGTLPDDIGAARCNFRRPPCATNLRGDNVYYQRRGLVPAKRFTTLRDASGSLYYEELLSSEGFNGPSSLLYRRQQPTRVLRVEPGIGPPLEPTHDTTVRNHLLVVDRVKAAGDELGSRVPLYFNDDLVYSLSRPTEAGARLYRNGTDDELLLVVEGSGVVETMFGDLNYGPLDFLYLPRGTTWRLRPGPTDHTIVVLETSGPCGPPGRYRNGSGQLLPRSLYSERDIRTPELQDPRDDPGEFTVAVKTGSVVTDYVMANHPFDVVGWDGALYPYALNLRDIEPLSGRVHLMPDMHQVFGSEGVLISAITPNRLPDHPDSYPAQADHSADCDEIFYRFATDDGSKIPGLGTITMHTRAVAHGPKPGFEDRRLPERSHLYGMIIDVLRPVSLTAAAMDADDPDYVRAWL
jgi:homogentisate 1,2-dioxygenase